ncbi:MULTISPECIES: DUF6301 family protein [unclassified Actinoplanes]|uniref:DUF6301 family protein n=1 Tax=unclassified Actinoplanes TaxID=2626549 RepID=UPI00031A6E4F|nr:MULTISPECIES: DUF6301 family protein [unclassified Actinoplanes]
MTGLDWQTFRDGLVRSIASLPNSGALIVGDEERTECFVQFMLDYDHVVAEVASGMDPQDRPNLTEQEAAALEKLGWLPQAAGDESAIEAFKQDAFTAAAAALTGKFGRPTDPLPGEEPQLWWRRQNTAFGLITRATRWASS